MRTLARLDLPTPDPPKITNRGHGYLNQKISKFQIAGTLLSDYRRTSLYCMQNTIKEGYTYICVPLKKGIFVPSTIKEGYMCTFYH